MTSPASSSRSLDALVRNRRAADPSKLGSLIRAATLGASRESFLSEAADETETSREDSLGKKSVEAAADLRRASPDRAGRYLRTTRRGAEGGALRARTEIALGVAGVRVLGRKGAARCRAAARWAEA